VNHGRLAATPALPGYHIGGVREGGERETGQRENPKRTS
jgi:hypothetical protein